MAKLSAQGRRQVKTFASPKGAGDDKSKDAYPVHDIEHGRAALRMVVAHGSAEEQRRVRRKVYELYPSLKQNSDMNSRIRSARSKRK